MMLSSHGPEVNRELFMGRDGEMELLEAYDPAMLVFHQDHLIAGFLTYILTPWVSKPDRQGTAFLVIKDLQWLHILANRPFI
jgi:hypothetical protein